MSVSWIKHTNFLYQVLSPTFFYVIFPTTGVLKLSLSPFYIEYINLTKPTMEPFKSIRSGEL